MSGVIFAIEVFDGFRHGCCGEIGIGDTLDAFDRPRDMDHGDAGEVDRFQRLLEGRAVLHHHHRRLDQAEQIFQFGVVLAHQRIGRRHRRRRKPRLHRRLCHQRMLDRVAGQDRHRTALGNAEIEQALGQRIDGALGLAVGHLAPLPVRTEALREPDPLRRLLGPFRQRGRNVLLVSLQRNARLQHNAAVGAPVDGDVALQPFDLAKGRLLQHCRSIPIHIASPEIWLLASSFVVFWYRPSLSSRPSEARAGIHNHRPLLLRKASTTFP